MSNECNDTNTVSDIGSFSINSNCSLSPRFKSPLVRGRVFQKPSEVIPDQSYTVRQLFERAVCGAMPAVAKEVYYDDENLSLDQLFNRSGVDLNTLDLCDLQAYSDELNSRISRARESLNKPRDKSSDKIEEV